MTRARPNTFPPSWSPERRAQLGGVVAADPTTLPGEGQIIWDLAQETFFPGDAWMWGSLDRRVYLGVVEKLMAFSQGDGRGVRIGVWMGGKFAVPIWPSSPSSLQPVRGRVWAAKRESDALYHSVTPMPDGVAEPHVSKARAVFTPGSRWVWGDDLSGHGTVRKVLAFRAGLGKPRVGALMVEDWTIPVWPAAPPNLQPDPSDNLIEGYDWRAAALAKSARYNPSKRARRIHWAQVDAARRQRHADLRERARGAVSQDSVALLRPVAYHVTDFRLLPRIRREGLHAGSFVTTEAGIPMWLEWLNEKFRYHVNGLKPQPVVLQVDTSGLELFLDGIGTTDAIDHVAGVGVGGSQFARLTQIVAAEASRPIPPSRIRWSRPLVRVAQSRRAPQQRYEALLPGPWKQNPSGRYFNQRKAE